MSRYAAMIFLGYWLWAVPATATQHKICTREQAIQAETEVSSLKDWDAVYTAFKHFAHCDDENIIEVWGAYTDTVVRLLSTNWPTIIELDRLTSAHREFEYFVIRHLDQTVPADAFAAIVRNARLNCPSEGKYLCKKIVDRYLMLIRENIQEARSNCPPKDKSSCDEIVDHSMKLLRENNPYTQ